MARLVTYRYALYKLASGQALDLPSDEEIVAVSVDSADTIRVVTLKTLNK